MAILCISIILIVVKPGQPWCGRPLHNHLLGSRNVHCSLPQHWRVNLRRFKWRINSIRNGIYSIPSQNVFLAHVEMLKDDNKNRPNKKCNGKRGLWLAEENCCKQLLNKYWPIVLVTSNRDCSCSFCGKLDKIATRHNISSTNTPPRKKKGMMTLENSPLLIAKILSSR